MDIITWLDTFFAMPQYSFIKYILVACLILVAADVVLRLLFGGLSSLMGRRD